MWLGFQVLGNQVENENLLNLLMGQSVLDLEGELWRPQLGPQNSRPGANGRAEAHDLQRDPVGVPAKRAGTKELRAQGQAFQGCFCRDCVRTVAHLFPLAFFFIRSWLFLASL